jgi:hypothetical protein
MFKRVAMLFVLGTTALVSIPSVIYMASSSPVNTSQSLQMSTVAIGPCDVDFNGDGVVDVYDIMQVASRWRSTEQADIDDYDLDGDDDIDIVDIMLVAVHWNELCPIPPFGIQMGSGDATVRQLVREAGVRWVRTSISWASVEEDNIDLTDPANGNWPDSGIFNLANEGFNVLVFIWKNPDWAASTSCGPLYPGMLEEFGEFLTALVTRYSQPPYNVKYWEFYNEPDIKDSEEGKDYGGCWGNNGAEYAQMLAEADAAIHGVDPEAKILLGGLAYEWWNGDYFNSGIHPTIAPGPTEWSTAGNEFPDFLEDVLSSGGGDHFDVMSFHSYVVFHPRWDLPDDGSLPGDVAYEPACSGSTDLFKRPQEGDILGKLIYLRKRLMKHNAAYGDKPFAVTEIGRRSDAGQSMLQQQDCLGGPVPGSDEQQSRYAVQGNVRAMAAGLEIAIWYDVVDNANGEYGLLDMAWNPKPAYWAYKTVTDELMEAVYDHQMTEGETGWTDVEGYEFQMPDGGQKWVLWTPTKVSGEKVRQVSFPASQVRVVPKQKYNETYPDTEIPGVVQVIDDGEPGKDLDGVENGQVMLNVSASPIFVEANP